MAAGGAAGLSAWLLGKVLQKEKKKNFRETSRDPFYENIIIKCKPGGWRERRKSINAF